MLEESTISDVRKCPQCGQYLVLSRHESCDAPTGPVDTKKQAHCQDCIYTRPDEWGGLSEIFKKDDLIKCWRTTPFESVPKTGKRCFRWLSDDGRFDPDGEDPVDVSPKVPKSMLAINASTIKNEASKGNATHV